MNKLIAREKFKSNPDVLLDNEVLGLVGVKTKTDMTLSDMLNMTLVELVNAGYSESDAIVIRSIKELAARYLAARMEKRDMLTSPERVAQFARVKIGGLSHEAFMLIFTNAQNEVLAHEIINEGTVDQVAVYPRRIIEKCLAYHAAGVILVHNHPSGYTTPSDDDKKLTRVVKDAARIMDIRLLDHIVVGASDHYSFLSNGIL